MKIIAILGSPRGMNGYTGSLLEPMLAAARSAGAETECFSLAELSVLPCKGCVKVCHTRGVCMLDDDYATIREAMLKADGFIFATPNYNFSVSAQMKALLDRCGVLLHCQMLKGKYAATVVTAGGSDPEEVHAYLSNILMHFGMRLVGGVSAVELQLEDPEQKAEVVEQAAALGRELVQAIQNRKIFPGQQEKHDQIFEIMAYLVAAKKDEWPFAYEYCTANPDMAI